MKNFDFIEIGTSDFQTLIETADDTTVGLSIEPLKVYLDRLPNKLNVRKINCAVAFDDSVGTSEIYYISEENIKKYNLPKWLKGCNSVGKYHYQHIIQQLENIVSIDTIDIVPIAKILTDNHVHGIKFLKIDTEGNDCYILKSLYKYLVTKPKSYWPEKIQFESNILSPEEVIVETINIYTNLGYTSKRSKEDTILFLTNGN